MFPNAKPPSQRPPPEVPSSASTSDLAKRKKSLPIVITPSLSPSKSKSKLDLSAKPSKTKLTDSAALKPQLQNSDSSASSNMISSTRVVNDSPTSPAVNEKPSELKSAVSIIKASDSDVSMPVANKVSSSF